MIYVEYVYRLVVDICYYAVLAYAQAVVGELFESFKEALRVLFTDLQFLYDTRRNLRREFLELLECLLVKA